MRDRETERERERERRVPSHGCWRVQLIAAHTHSHTQSHTQSHTHTLTHRQAVNRATSQKRQNKKVARTKMRMESAAEEKRDSSVNRDDFSPRPLIAALHSNHRVTPTKTSLGSNLTLRPNRCVKALQFEPFYARGCSF